MKSEPIILALIVSATSLSAQEEDLAKNFANPISDLISQPILPGMKKNADGLLTTYLQKDSPGADKESNWLPAPDGSVHPVMRLHRPETEAASILPPGEGSRQPPRTVKTD